MTRDEMEIRVSEVLELVLKVRIRPGEPLLRPETPEWDSLNHVEIVYAVEESLEVAFSEAEISALDSSRAIVDAVERHRAA